MTASGNYKLEDNPLCLLDICDIVVLDPIATGYGQLLYYEAKEEVFGFEQDAAAIASVIEHWVIENKRYDSKKYLLGESYGTNRNTAVANILMGGCTDYGCVSRGITIDGMINLGSDISIERFHEQECDKDFTENLKLLPSYAATTAYYQTGSEENFQETLEHAFSFCADTYVRALFLGQLLSRTEQESVAKQLAQLTGLDDQKLRAAGLRVSLTEYLNQYKDRKGLSVSPYDTRFSAINSPFIETKCCVADDEMMGRCMPAFLSAFHALEKELLGIDLEREYKVINFSVNESWTMEGNYTPFQHLQRTLLRNKNFRVFFGTGAYDLVTPCGNVRFTASRLSAEKGQIIIKEYPSGHMSYVGDESAVQLAEDIRKFVRGETC